jgi:4-hydroxy-tetrahydrodipicolinate reductase
MGRAIIAAIDERDDLHLSGVWVRDAQAAAALPVPAAVQVSADLDRVFDAADVIIDFSLSDATSQVVATAVRQQKPLVCGVSGLDDEQIGRIDAASAVIPVVYDCNMSQGIAVLERLIRQAATTLGMEFEVEIDETHHVHKKDAPSGTALKLGAAVAEARDQPFAAVRWYAPEATTAKPAAGDIRFEVERRGDVYGDHTVSFASATERLAFSHSVTSRRVFAAGALRAATWISTQAPGRFDMADVLFHKT